MRRPCGSIPSGRSFSAAGEGAVEIDVVIDILFDHTDSDGRNTVARRITRRVLEYFCHGRFAATTPEVATAVDDIVEAAGFASTWDLESLLWQILVSDAFFETAAPAPWNEATAKSVKSIFRKRSNGASPTPKAVLCTSRAVSAPSKITESWWKRASLRACSDAPTN